MTMTGHFLLAALLALGGTLSALVLNTAGQEKKIALLISVRGKSAMVEKVRKRLAAMGYAAENIQVLSGAGATRAEITKNIKQSLPRDAANDSTVFFWLGDPCPKSGGKPYLLPADVEEIDGGETGIYMTNVLTMLSKLKARRVIAVTGDCTEGVRITSTQLSLLDSDGKKGMELSAEEKGYDAISSMSGGPRVAGSVLHGASCELESELDFDHEAEDAAFQEKLKTQKAPEEISEEAHRFEVQARAAVKEEDFKGAAKRYAKGLELEPLWAQGHYNYALILAKLACHADAIRQMKRYLLISPRAPDARKAKDKIYEWEAKVEE